jgi:hypothetical protein
VVAEATAREIGLSLEEALQLVLLYAAYEPSKLERAALRSWSSPGADAAGAARVDHRY